MSKILDSTKYLELPHSRAYEHHHFEEIQHGLPIFDRHYYRILIKAMVSDLYDPKRKQLKLLEEAWSASKISEANDFCES